MNSPNLVGHTRRDDRAARAITRLTATLDELGRLRAGVGSGHKNIQHIVGYTDRVPNRFKDFWKD